MSSNNSLFSNEHEDDLGFGLLFGREYCHGNRKARTNATDSEGSSEGSNAEQSQGSGAEDATPYATPRLARTLRPPSQRSLRSRGRRQTRRKGTARENLHVVR